MIDFDESKVLVRLGKRVDKAQFALDQQVLKDSTYYVPQDVGGLMDSGVLGSSLGVIEWNSVYASRQYYEDNNKSKDKNPNASMKWFEVAKSKELKNWEQLANDKYNG